MDQQIFDVIIVGAGAAGCVLAGRLSEDARKSVLLIESGDDSPPEQEHPDIRDPYPVSAGNPCFSWELTAEVGADPGDGSPRLSRRYLQGHSVGGGSNLQGMVALRGLPGDYDEWRDFGAEGWGWADCLPYFRRLETDRDFRGPLHGDSGPMPVWRLPQAQWTPFYTAMEAALKRRGYEALADFNGEFGDGYGAIPMANRPLHRVSASMAYLTKAVRQRPNLTIVANTRARRLLISNQQIEGVEAHTAAGLQRFRGREVIVSCGALFSPALLMRSGIGPGEHLRASGIPVALDLPGVGCNLQNHPELLLVTHLPRRAAQDRSIRTWAPNGLRYSSGVAGCPAHDMMMAIFNKGAWHPLGRRTGGILVNVNKSFSRGKVELTGPDLASLPKVQFNLLSDERDFERMVRALRMMLELMDDPEVKPLHHEIFFPNREQAMHLHRRTASNTIRSWAMMLALEIGPIRARGLRAMAIDVEALLADGTRLRDFVRRRAGVVHHPVGTCRIGSANDPMAVVDSACRVRGIQGLRVIDASVFPTITRANTHFPVLMAAEKMADRVKAEWRSEEHATRHPLTTT